MNWKLGLWVVVLSAFAACPVKPDDLSCDAGCLGDEHCDVATNLCVPRRDAGVTRDGGDDGLVDAGLRDAGTFDGGAPDAGPCTPSEVCREAHGLCDLAETCNSNRECPPDGFKSSTVECKSVVSDCDVAEYCTGDSPDCPLDVVAPSNKVCHAPVGVCDAPEFCDGITTVCPVDSYWTLTTVCHPTQGDCDPEERCSGASPDCPPDLRLPQDTSCRLSQGDCDREETCDGTSPTCPVDRLRDAGSVCRIAADVCDVQEVCTGTDAGCPADAYRQSGSVCRGDAGVCDVAETCTGTDTMCPLDAFQSSGVKCADPTCSAASSTAARYCAGNANVCNTTSSVSCNGYQCTALGDTCRTTCASNSDCVTSTHFCDTTVTPNPACSPRRADGQLCTSESTGYQCASNSCISMFTDSDHDGYGVGVSSFRCGATAPTGYSTNNSDCCDTDLNAKPGQTGWFTTARTGCGGYDYDCSGGETKQYTAVNACQTSGSCTASYCNEGTGWTSGASPACGASATFATGCTSKPLTAPSCNGGETCQLTSATRAQPCH